MKVLSAVNVSKSFGALAVTRNVTLELEDGARHAIIGPNGAGKTTLINLLSGILKPDSGTIRLGDQDATNLLPHQRARRGLGRTFQINNLFPGFTPMEAVMLAVCEHTGAVRKPFALLSGHSAEMEEAEALVRQVGLSTVAHYPTADLAYGHQRALEIALALASRPRFLLLDEPAAGVPKRESASLFEIIAALPKSVAVLFIEHNIELVFRFAERISVLVAGEIIHEGTPAEIAADSRVRAVYLGSKSHGRHAS